MSFWLTGVLHASSEDWAELQQAGAQIDISLSEKTELFYAESELSGVD